MDSLGKNASRVSSFLGHTVTAARPPTLVQPLPTKPYLGGCPSWGWLLGISFQLAGSHCTPLRASLLDSRRLTCLDLLFTWATAILQMG